jgi:predicted membrane-bound spermidine synthase
VSLLFLAAYTCSGLAGLVYEVSWTRLLTLYIGHTTAAASAVVAAFLGGLAAGAAGGGVVASRMRPSQALRTYAALELIVAVCAFALPFELRALTPLLSWAYADATPGLLFPIIRLGSCLALVFAPAAALGATFPMAVRWFAHRSTNPAGVSSALYSMNTVGVFSLRRWLLSSRGARPATQRANERMPLHLWQPRHVRQRRRRSLDIRGRKHGPWRPRRRAPRVHG